VLRYPDGGAPDAVIIATGSEVQVALEAQAVLAEEGVRARVVSMPSWEIFERQPAEYRESVLPEGIAVRVSVEAGATFGWERWVGDRRRALGLDRFGASAPGHLNMEKFGFTAENVADVVREALRGGARPSYAKATPACRDAARGAGR
jgi:transketolase